MRCFVALKLDDQIKVELLRGQQFFADLPGKVSWTKPQQMHLTLKFLGEVPDKEITGIIDVMKRAAQGVGAFDFKIAGLGAFPPGGKTLRILWAGIEAPQELVKLNDLLQHEFDEIGYPAEQRTFTPHLTLGRVKFVKRPDRYREIIDSHADFRAGIQHADSVILYQSELRREGAVYTPMATVELEKDK